MCGVKGSWTGCPSHTVPPPCVYSTECYGISHPGQTMLFTVFLLRRAAGVRYCPWHDKDWFSPFHVLWTWYSRFTSTDLEGHTPPSCSRRMHLSVLVVCFLSRSKSWHEKEKKNLKSCHNFHNIFCHRMSMDFTKLGKRFYSRFTEINIKKYLSSAHAAINFAQWPLEDAALPQDTRRKERAFNGSVQTTSSAKTRSEICS